MMFLAAIAGAVSALWRVRRLPIDGPLLTKGMIVALIVGWICGRVGLWLDGTARDAGFRILSPWYQVAGSLTYFLLGVCLGLLAFGAVLGKMAFDYLDALAPSTFIALAFAKIGCLLAGCCAGQPCPGSFGISYPYGSPPYEHQYRNGRLTVPAELVRPVGHEKSSPFWGQMQLIELRPESVAKGLAESGLSRERAAAIIAAAREQHSLPVWPVPVMVSVASLVLWIAAEVVFRTSKRPGVTVAFVFASYGALRLTLDWLIAQRGTLHLGLTLAQWVGLCALMLSAVIFVRGMPRTHPTL